MRDKHNATKFGVGLVFGALLGGVAAFFLSPKSGKENREMLAQKMKEFEKWLDEKNARERVEKVFGEVSKESTEIYKRVSSQLSVQIEGIREKMGKIDFDKFKELLSDVIDGVKKDYKTTPDQMKKLRQYMESEWQKFAKEGQAEK